MEQIGINIEEAAKIMGISKQLMAKLNRLSLYKISKKNCH